MTDVRCQMSDVRKKAKSNGFTLVEILVTISIIAIMYGVIITSTTGIRRGSRDAQRESDLRSIQAALAQYYADQQFYPVAPLPTSGGISGSTGCASSCPSTSKTYLSSIPKDPLDSSVYGYQTWTSPQATASCDNLGLSSRCQYYYLCAKLEATNPNPNSCGNQNYNYQITPL